MSDSDGGGPPPFKENKCAKCGACTAVCPVYRASGNEIYSARGKQHLAEVFADRQPSPVFEDIYSKCLLCGACSTVCPRKLDIPEEVAAARSTFSALYGEHGYQKFLARKVLGHPVLLGAARLLGRPAAELLGRRLPADSGLRLRLALFNEASGLAGDHAASEVASPQAGDLTELAYFPGCAARFLYPEIVTEIESVLAGFGYRLRIPGGQGCCGLAMQAAGKADEARRAARKNIGALEQTGGPILVSCGSCYAHLASYRHLFANDDEWRQRAETISERVVEISRFVDDLLTRRPVAGSGEATNLRVFYHDPCHLRHGAGITGEPRSILRSLPGVELLELPDGPQCCGQGGLFHLGAPELSAAIRDDLGGKILALQPDVITTTCSGCLMQLKTAMAAAGSDVPVVHLAKLVKQRLAGAVTRSD
ncbi:(Fe-S)-binding protein [Desulfofustis glycolicus]|uniref:Glycolate oxidase iron-sulfur subunit n=1 Tax=Desulfofustis glycolicus DSM 9705 TaxID=1121409 RepID=A0A1M5SB96_9BACT|nr:(Fe-S)-binding protein [Desulfofustis glycolicus]MCB2216170.1 (Fe-S)-binding protein [Desulfobulbaceae bacterium]SHH35784.1 glycolate oxidase iron-sulfur subunit [Desulfofustis glycolicus DSM 9705]